MANKLCDVCKEIFDDDRNPGMEISVGNRNGCLCQKCARAYSTIFSENNNETEKAAAENYFKQAIQNQTASSLGMDFIAGNILDRSKNVEQNATIERTSVINSELKKIGFSGFLKVLAWLIWIGGLIIAISGANVTTISSYSYRTYTEFSFSTFLSLFLTYLIYGILLMGLAKITDQIADTNEKVNEIAEYIHMNGKP